MFGSLHFVSRFFRSHRQLHTSKIKLCRLDLGRLVRHSKPKGLTAVP